LLALAGAHHFVDVSRIRVKLYNSKALFYAVICIVIKCGKENVKRFEVVHELTELTE
jgi:hypothetical protein